MSLSQLFFLLIFFLTFFLPYFLRSKRSLSEKTSSLLLDATSNKRNTFSFCKRHIYLQFIFEELMSIVNQSRNYLIIQSQINKQNIIKLMKRKHYREKKCYKNCKKRRNWGLLLAKSQCQHVRLRARSMVSQNFRSSKEREDATQAVEPIMLAREPVAIQWKAHNFGSRNIKLAMDPTLYDI